MDVSNLKAFLLSLEAPLRVSNAAKVADELKLVAEMMEPFREMSLRDFASFLAQADEYRRTGIVPTTSRGKRPARKVDEAQVKEIASHIARLAETSIDASESYDDIEQEVKQLLKKPTKDVAVAVARELQIPSSFKTKGDVVNALVTFATERKFTFERTRF